MTFLAAAGIAAAAVFVAEFGDKSQLLILAFATRAPAGPVVAGLVVAALLVQGVSVAIGAGVGAVLPGQLVAIASGIAFLAVAAWTLRGGDEDAIDDTAARSSRRGWLAIAGAVAAAFVLSEIGDKTMLVTVGLATRQGAIPTWLGSAAGEVAANLLAVAVGRQLGSRLTPRAIRIGSAALFALAGSAILVAAILER